MPSFNNSVVLKNVIWRYGERFFAQIVTFVVSLALARILSPEEYGTVAIVTVIVNMMEIFSTRGFNLALIQKKEVKSVDYATIFYSNFLIECFLYFIVFLLAPIVANFYENKELTLMIRILAVKLLINGFNSVQQAYVQRNMLYRKFFLSTLLGTILSGGIGLILAIKGFGAWALIIQILINTFVDTFVLFLTIDWKPKLEYSFKCFKEMSRYGTGMLGQAILESIYSEIRSLSIGKMYSASDLAFYEKGQHIPTIILSNFQTAASNVFFSALSREDDNVAVKQKMRLYIGGMFYVLCPMMIGLATISKSVIVIFYTAKWLEAIPYMIIYCFSYLTWVIQIPICQAINSRGMVKESFSITLLHRINGIILLLIFMKSGPILIAFTALVADIVITTILLIFANKYFDYKFYEFLSDISATLLLSLVMVLLILLIDRVIDSYVIKFVAQLTAGICIYILLSMITQNYWFQKIKSISIGIFEMKLKTGSK